MFQSESYGNRQWANDVCLLQCICMPIQMTSKRRRQLIAYVQTTGRCAALPVSQIQRETSELYVMSFRILYLGYDACRCSVLQALLGFRHSSGYRIQPLQLQRREWARVVHGLLLRLDIAHRRWKHAWFWLFDRPALGRQPWLRLTATSLLCRLPHGAQEENRVPEKFPVLKVSVSLCCERTCIKVYIQLEMQIRSVNTASSGTRICSQPSRTLDDTGDIFIPEEETISQLSRYMEFTDISTLRSPLSCSSKTKKNFSKKEAERNCKQSKFDQGSALFLGELTALDPQGTVLTTALNGRETWGKPTKSLHLIKSAYNFWHCCQQTWATKNPGCHAKFIKYMIQKARSWREVNVSAHTQLTACGQPQIHFRGLV